MSNLGFRPDRQVGSESSPSREGCTMQRSGNRPLGSVAMLVLGASTVCFAQLDRASLSGTVTDPTGGVVSGTKVEGSQTATKATFTATSNESGVYNFLGLPIGDYSVTAAKEGFSKTVRPNVVLTANSYVRVDLGLTPGAVTQQIEVV